MDVLVANQDQFEEAFSQLHRIVARDYAQFLAEGFDIAINGRKLEGFPFTVLEGADFKPIREKYIDDAGVEIEIIAGMAGPPPDDLEPTERRAETNYYGWFVICNDRVVVASDKTDKTVWGDGDFQSWHYQYNGFTGVVSFSSKNPNLLPWTITKRDVDASNTAYRRAIEKMKTRCVHGSNTQATAKIVLKCFFHLFALDRVVPNLRSIPVPIQHPLLGCICNRSHFS